MKDGKGSGKDKLLRTGVCAAPVLDRSVRKRLGELYSETGRTESGAAAVSVPVLLGKAYCGRRAVMAAAGELTAEGCVPETFCPVILLPPGSMESELRQIADEIGEACRQEEMKVCRVHAEVTGAVKQPVVIGAALGTPAAGVSEDGRSGPEGPEIVMTGYAAAEAAWLIALQCREELEAQFPHSFIEKCLRLGKLPDIGKAGRIFREEICGGELRERLVYVCAGGLYAALWKLMERTGCGFSVDTKAVPVRQESIEIAEYYDFDPFAAASGGCFLAVTEDSERLMCRLREEGIPASVIGRMDPDRKSRAGRLCGGEETRYVDLPPADAVLKVLGDQGRR